MDKLAKLIKYCAKENVAIQFNRNNDDEVSIKYVDCNNDIIIYTGWDGDTVIECNRNVDTRKLVVGLSRYEELMKSMDEDKG